jgi:hypothetical protein
LVTVCLTPGVPNARCAQHQVKHVYANETAVKQVLLSMRKVQRISTRACRTLNLELQAKNT